LVEIDANATAAKQRPAASVSAMLNQLCWLANRVALASDTSAASMIAVNRNQSDRVRPILNLVMVPRISRLSRIAASGAVGH